MIDCGIYFLSLKNKEEHNEIMVKGIGENRNLYGLQAL